MKWSAYVLFILILTLTGCSQQLLVPIDYQPEAKNYQAFVDLEDAVVALENLEVTGSHLIFGLEITNEGQEPIRIQMDQVQNFMSFEPIEQQSPDQSIFLEKPLTAQQINKHFKSKVQSANIAGALLFVIGTALVVNDIVKDANDASDENWDRKKANKSASRDVATFVGLSAVDIASDINYVSKISAYEELEYLPDELFMREWIQPGEIYRGKIFFPRKEIFNYYRIKIPLDDKILIFDFKRANALERASLRN